MNAISLLSFLRWATLSLTLAFAVAVANQAQAKERRVVAVGDIHGDLESFVAILLEAKLIDQDRRWIGRDATLVQTGDFLDRGPKDVEAMDFLRSLQSQASKSGGEVIVLLGNHEVLNLIRDFRYVSDESFAAFADEKSERRRQDAFQEYVSFLKKRAARRGEVEPVFDESFRESWMARHPSGYLERIKALEGKYRKWLRGLPAVVQVDDTIFLHAGIHPDLAALSLDKINRRVKEDLTTFNDYLDFLVRREVILPFFSYLESLEAATEELARVRRTLSPESAPLARSETERLADYAKILESFLSQNWMTLHPDGPIWFRGYAEWGEEGEEQLDALLENYQAKRFVVGHSTVLKNGIEERFGGKAFLIDTGMLSSYYPGGRASALEIRQGLARPIYLPADETTEPSRKAPDGSVRRPTPP